MLARFTVPRHGQGERLRALAAVLEVEELLYLATCSRVVVLFAGGPEVSIHERRRRWHAFVTGCPAHVGDAERLVRAWEGEGLVEHLFLLTTGLDSPRVGESEIVGQLRSAIAEATGVGLIGARLRPLLDDALLVARRVRPLTERAVGHASLADIVVQTVVGHLGDRTETVALLGVSPMTTRCALALAPRGVPTLVVNRSLDRAESLASRVGGAACSLEAFQADPPSVTAIISATGGTHPVLDRAALEQVARAAGPQLPLLVDLGVPANIEHTAARAMGYDYVGIDAIAATAASGRDTVLDALAEARVLVDAAVEDRRRREWTAAADAAIVEMRRRLRNRAYARLEDALATDLSGLGPRERAAVSRLTDAVVQGLAHMPSRGLRDLAEQVGPDAVATFLEHAAPDLAAALRGQHQYEGAI